MKTLLTNAKIFNAFSCSLLDQSVLLEDGMIAGVGEFDPQLADLVVDLEHKILCPGFIDAHIHIESTTLTPYELARAQIPFGTTAIVADPHEIANVCGQDGIEFMIQSSQGLPLDVYFMLPSCVPATPIKDSGAVLRASDLRPFYKHERVLGLAEVMNVPAVLNNDPEMMAKIADAKANDAAIDGHSPMLSGPDLDAYIKAGIQTDHECAAFEEAKSKIEKGMFIQIRQGTAAKNLNDLIRLFEYPWCLRSCICTDDKHPDDLKKTGHINGILKEAVALGADPLHALLMSTWNPAQIYKMTKKGAIAPGYDADLIVLDDLKDFHVSKVFKNGKEIYSSGVLQDFEKPKVDSALQEKLFHSMNMSFVEPDSFRFDHQGVRKAHVIGHSTGSLLTEDLILDVDFDFMNGVNPEKDLVKIAVMDRHHNSGRMSLGLIHGMGLKEGALASTVAHDSHNLIAMGTNPADMALASNTLIERGGGLCAVKDGQILAFLPLPIGGLISAETYEKTAEANEELTKAIHEMGSGQELFMSMAFMSLPVIPSIKITTYGLTNDQLEIIDFLAE